MSTDRFPPIARLAGAIVAALAVATVGHANIIVVDATCTLDKAIDTANFDSPVDGCAVAGSGRDTIKISADNTLLTDELPWIVSDIDFVGSGAARRAITGDGTHRLFFIGDDGRTPTVTFSNIAFNAGVAHGGNSVDSPEAGGGAGAGAGMGGALFIASGNVSVSACSFSSSSAVGGSSSGYVRFGVENSGSGSGGGGGMFGTGGVGGDEFNPGLAGGSGGFGGGGGGGGDTYLTESGGSSGGAGGYGTFGGYGGTGGIAGSYNSGSGEFGGGGGGGAGSASGQTPGQSGAQGGFGGGGGGGGGAGGNVNSFVAGGGGAGGFGAGGGAGGTAGAYGNGGAGGNGGFGGGAGAGGLGNYGGAPGLAGYGGGEQFEGGGGGGAGFGGAIFIRTGQLDLVGNQFDNNSSATSVTSGNPGTAKGGALFALHTLHNTNGNDQGMPDALPEVTGCGNDFTGSIATSAATTDVDNASTFGTSLAALVQTCDAIFGNGFDSP